MKVILANDWFAPNGHRYPKSTGRKPVDIPEHFAGDLPTSAKKVDGAYSPPAEREPHDVIEALGGNSVRAARVAAEKQNLVDERQAKLDALRKEAAEKFRAQLEAEEAEAGKLDAESEEDEGATRGKRKGK